MNLIGLTGPARSGKSEVAKVLAEITPGPVEIRGFADLVKLAAAKSLDVDFHPDDVGTTAVRRWADELKLTMSVQLTDVDGQVIHSISGRRFLQCFGTEAHRELFGESFWIDQMDFEPDGYQLLVLDDVRFPDEAQAVLEHGGEVWRVVRHNIPTGDHRSELPLPDEFITREIPNISDLAHLRQRVEETLGAAV